MRIYGVTSRKENPSQKINFTAGKVDLYSDFDGTYFPEKHSRMYNLPQEDLNGLNKYFKSFKLFFQNLREDLSFRITTGRTFGEFQTVSELIKSKGVEMPLPDALITKNGSDEYLKTGSDRAFYRSGEFPFSYSKPNSKIEKAIKAETNWNSSLRAKLRQILEKYNFQVIEHDSENPATDYGQRSIMAHVRYDDFELKEGLKPNSEWKVGLRNDGNLKLYVSFPYDMLHADERKAAYEEIKTAFESYLTADKKVKYHMEEYRDKIGGNRPVIEYVPLMNDGTPLNKLYDTKKAVEKAIKTNDLVITAGDGKNDLEMLNPLNYIETDDLAPELKKEIQEVSDKNIAKILENSTVVERLRKLPFVGIVVKSEDSTINSLLSHFKQFNKIIEIENGKLQEGISQAIKMYAKDNSEFAESMSEKLKTELGLIKKQVAEAAEEVQETIKPAEVIEEIKNEVKETTPTLVEVASDTSKKAKGTSGGKIAAIVAAITAGIGAIAMLFKKGEKS